MLQLRSLPAATKTPPNQINLFKECIFLGPAQTHPFGVGAGSTFFIFCFFKNFIHLIYLFGCIRS